MFIWLVLEFEWDLHVSIETSKTLTRAVDDKSTEYDALSDVVAIFRQTFGIDHTPSGSSPQSHVLALSGHMRRKLREALHIGVKWALAIVFSHYEANLERVSKGYTLPEGDYLAEVEVRKLADVVEGQGATLAHTLMRRWFRLCPRLVLDLTLLLHP